MNVNIALLMGPTGSGKTARSVVMARQLRAPMVAIDRFQVFEELATGTNRPALQETQGTEHILLAERRVAQGELSAAECYALLVRLVEALARRHRALILEGGSTSLCSLLFEQGFIERFNVEVELLRVPDPGDYQARLEQRVREMLTGSFGRRSMLEELAQFWHDPAQVAFVESIVGYDVLVRRCRQSNMTPSDLMGQSGDAGLVDEIVTAHLQYARYQDAVFERLHHTYNMLRSRRSARNAAPQTLSGGGGDMATAPPSTAIDFDPLSPDQLLNPYPIYQRLRKEAPVFHCPTLDAWLISRYDHACEVLKDPTRFSALGATKVKAELPAEVRAILAQGVPYVRTLLDNDPPEHMRFRNLVNKAFLPQRIAELEPEITRVANELIDGFCAEAETDIMHRFAFPLPGRVITSILGLTPGDLDDLKRWCDDWMALQSATAPLEQLVACAHSYLRMQRYFLAIIEERAQAPQGDMLSALLQARIAGEAPLSKDEMVRLLMSLFVAGHETTTHSIGNILGLLLQNPNQLAALQADPSLASQALEEGLRMDPPIQSLFRRVVADTELGGVRIPAGARVMVLYGSANRDEAQFPDPDRFDIYRRSAINHISFSRGIHFCLGSAMARMEGRIALALLARRLPNLGLKKGQALRRLPHFFLRGYEHLYLVWEPEANARAPQQLAAVAD